MLSTLYSHTVLQSCEIVGILPAEELALKKALYASLVQESSKNKSSDTEASPLKLEPDTGHQEHEVICLSSPDISDDESQGKAVHGRTSQPVSSCPSSPLSSNSMHLCLSSSSSWSTSSECSSSSFDSLFSPSSWSPVDKKKLNKRQSSKGKGKEGKSVPKKSLTFDEKSEWGRVGVKSRTVCEEKPSVVVQEKPKRQTARKSALVCRDDGVKDTPYQAQSKFVANHVPSALR